jgi:hypothetical protein
VIFFFVVKEERFGRVAAVFSTVKPAGFNVTEDSITEAAIIFLTR